MVSTTAIQQLRQNQNVQTFIKLVEDKFDTKDIKFKYRDVFNFIEQDKEYSHQIHADCNRSLHTFSQIFRSEKINLKAAQSLFERFIQDIIMQLSPQNHKIYFQGFTDIYELIFVYYINFDRLREFQQFLKIDEENNNYQQFLGDITQLFDKNYQQIQNININILLHTYKQTGFDLNVIQKQTQLIINYVKQYDTELYDFLTIIPDLDKQAILLKYQLTLCMHYSKSPSIMYYLGYYKLILTIDQQAFLIQQLLSNSIRANSNILSSNYKHLYESKVLQTNIELEEEDKSDEIRAIQMLSQSIEDYLSYQNEKQVQQKLSQVLKNYNDLKIEKNSNIIKAITLVSASVIIPGIGLLASLLSKKD